MGLKGASALVRGWGSGTLEEVVTAPSKTASGPGHRGRMDDGGGGGRHSGERNTQQT